MTQEGRKIGIDPPDARRADAMLRWSVAEVPFYAGHPSRLAGAPFIDARTVRLHWEQFTRRGGEELIDHVHRSEQRFSSGSTAGAKLRTVVEREVAKNRRGYENVVTRAEAPSRAKLFLGRPESLDLHWRAGVAIKRGVRWVAVTPGPDPTVVKTEDWDRLVELLVQEDPDCIEADPAYLSPLARRCHAHGVELGRLGRVIVGHSFCWRVYAAPIEQAFRQPVRACFATSEFGIVGVSCDEGRLHLLETGLFIEVVANGRGVAEGEIGALAVTTLDTRLRPLVRYLTGDVVRLVSRACPCGRPYRVIQFEGRMTNLLADGRGRPVTYRDLDAVIGAPPGVEYFKLRETPDGLVLELLASRRELVPAATLRSSLAERLGRPIALRFADGFAIRSHGKHLAIETDDRYASWLPYFLGRKAPPVPAPSPPK